MRKVSAILPVFVFAAVFAGLVLIAGCKSTEDTAASPADMPKDHPHADQPKDHPHADN